MSAVWVSTSIFIWVVILGALLGLFLSLLSGKVLRRFQGTKIILLPALVLSPLVLILGKLVFDVNLIFPIQIGTPSHLLFFSLSIPSLVLLICSGLARGIYVNISELSEVWLKKQCALMSRSLGLSARAQLRPLILIFGSSKAWAQALPWIFGELIIVECMFNAPGIGHALWSSAKQRSALDLWFNLSLLLGIYFLFLLINRVLGEWLGKRLENYI